MSILEMEIYENIQSLEFSLKTICAVNVVHRILDSVGMKRKDYQGLDVIQMLEHVTTEGSKRVEKLNLPTRIKELLVRLSGPIFRELDAWHNEYLLEICPTWSPHGTVDLVRSSKTVVDDPNLKISYRFKVACTFCHERQIFELAQQLTRQELAAIYAPLHMEPYGKPSRHNPSSTHCYASFDYRAVQLNFLWHPLIKFWMNVIRGGNFHLTQETLLKGLHIALNGKNEAAVIYFLGRLEPEGVLRVLNDCVNALSLLSWGALSPTTYCLLYSKISDPDLRRTSFNDFVFSLLASLTGWPYQPLFLVVARSLCVHAKETTVSELLIHIARRAAQGSKDFDYRDLFVGFCETIVRLHPEWSLGKCLANSIVVAVLRTEDELWINFVYGKLCEREKRHLLFSDDCMVFTWIMNLQKYHLLEPFIKRCCGTRIDLLLKVRDALMLPEFMSRWEPHGKAALQRLIPQIVKKLIAERGTSKRNPSRETSKKRFKGNQKLKSAE